MDAHLDALERNIKTVGFRRQLAKDKWEVSPRVERVDNRHRPASLTPPFVEVLYESPSKEGSKK